MNDIKVLDCTLRDGGYVNKWDFGFKRIVKILKNLNNAKIDYAEIGFLKDCEYDKEKSVFNEIKEIENILPEESLYSKTVAMIVFGQFSKSKLVPKTPDIKLDSIRVTFKKHEIKDVFSYFKKIKDCGYEVFVNPTNIETYSDSELLDLIEKVNKLKPYGFSIVDTNGVLKERNLQRLYYLIDNNLDEDIALCFHSHNNLQLSFSNAQCLMKVNRNRQLIIDSTIFGMGRGAGNLCTELLTEYINDNYDGNYDIIPILKIIDEQINPIFANTPWGYSVPYYLAAKNHCHPNYAKYLVEKQTVPVEVINNLLKLVPNNKKSLYDTNLIRQIYLDNFSHKIDDTDTVKYLKETLEGKDLLVIAPGKTLMQEQEKIDNYIKSENPFIISLNFDPENYSQDLVFITNLKRFSSIENNDKPLVVTSNIESIPQNAKLLNYSSYLNNSRMFDNTALMLLKLLGKIGVKKVTFAGLDGFNTKTTENYISNEFVNNGKEGEEFDERNQIMSEEWQKFAKKIDIKFLTKSQYTIN